MLHLSGECRGIVETPERTGKGGETFPARYQVQIETVEEVNGFEKVSLWPLFGKAEDIRPFSALKGSQVTVAVRPYVSGRVVAFALAEGARPLPPIHRES